MCRKETGNGWNTHSLCKWAKTNNILKCTSANFYENHTRLSLFLILDTHHILESKISDRAKWNTFFKIVPWDYRKQVPLMTHWVTQSLPSWRLAAPQHNGELSGCQAICRPLTWPGNISRMSQSKNKASITQVEKNKGARVQVLVWKKWKVHV